MTTPIVHSDLTTTPGIKTWGDNGAGELGDATLEQSFVPVPAITAAAGEFVVRNGVGDWACPILVKVDQTRGATLVTSQGSALATASFSES